MGKRILLTTTGSLGDLHPYIAIGLELRARGHHVTLATSNFYRAKIEKAGLNFSPMGPHMAMEGSVVMARVLDSRKGPEYLIRKLLYPSVPAAYAEVMAALKGAELIVTHPITYAAHIAAEKTGIPWISTVTTPMSFFSCFDASVIAPYPFPIKVRALGPGAYGVLLKLGRLQTRFWRAHPNRFRASIGLPPGADPIFEGQFSPRGVLALFSSLMGEPQPDWPPKTRVTGFPFYDQAEHGQGMDEGLERFLDAGEPPVVFTLGSSAVFRAGNFYKESIAAIQRLGCRAVLLTGGNPLPSPLPPGVFELSYAPYSQILPRASAVVHSGGIVTSGQALAAGRPMLVVPHAFDQPDNAARLRRLGVAFTIHRHRYTSQRVCSALMDLLSASGYRECAAQAAQRIARENGVGAACDAIDYLSLSS